MTNLLTLLLVPFFVFGQNDYANFSTEQNSKINKVLDSVVNETISNHSTLIYIKEKLVIIDTLSISKVKLLKKDSTVLVKYSNKTERLIRVNDFWGVITDFGERRRFYRGNSFVIWHTKTPYIYKTFNANLTKFYFSETLMDSVFPLTVERIDKNVTNLQTKDWLNNYIQENDLLTSNSIKNNKGAFVSSSLDFLSIAFELIEECIRSNRKVKKNRKLLEIQDRRKMETGSFN